MPWQESSVTPEDVADRLGVAVNDDIVIACDVARAWAIRNRSLTDPVDLFGNADSWFGTVLYAELLVQSAASPAGFPSFNDPSSDDYVMFVRARDLVGADLVTA